MAHCVYHIYGVLKLFEIAVCFAHCSSFEIFTAVMRTVLTMKKEFKALFPIWCTVYIIFTLF